MANKIEVIKTDLDAEVPFELIKEFFPNGDTRLSVRPISEKKEEKKEKEVKKKEIKIEKKKLKKEVKESKE